MKKNTIFFMARRCSRWLRGIVPEQIRMDMKECMVGHAIDSFLKERVSYMPEEYPEGINLIGSIRAEMGLGQSCRLVAHELERSGLKFSVFNVRFGGELREQDTSFDKYLSDQLPYAVNLFHVNPCELGKVFMSMPDAWKGHYNIAFWLWELEEFPREWIKYCALFDEIWTPSAFSGKGIRKVTAVPVSTLPYSVPVSVAAGYSRRMFGLPEDKFLFLVMFDSNSTIGRKNPIGALQAYRKAFPEERENCGIVIKVNNARNEDIESLRKELTGYQNVYFITEILEKEQVNSLIQCADVFVSLHRAEGFGLVMAEAMQLGTPVVATDWSSNTEFMTPEGACMVKFHLVQNDRTEGLYRKGCVWAEPDLEDAAQYMRKLVEDAGFYAYKREQGRLCIEQKLNEQELAGLWGDTFRQVFSRINRFQKGSFIYEKNS